MFVPLHFDIIFNNEDAVYGPGDDISGIVRVILDEDITLHDMKLRLQGLASTKWYQSQPYSKRIRFGALEHILEETEYLERYDDARYGQEMARGTYEYSFCFVLPQDCPPSFHSFHGTILYNMTVSLQRPGKLDSIFSKPVTVVTKKIRPRSFILIHDEVTVNTKKILSVAFFKSGIIDVSMKVDRVSFSPGEKIVVHLDVENKSIKKITRVRISVIQQIEYVGFGLGKQETRNAEYCIDHQNIGASIPELSRWQSSDELVLPLTTPSPFTSNLINMSYAIMATVIPGGPYPWFTLKIPVNLIC